MSTLHYLFYASTAVNDLSQTQLLDLLNSARHFNQAHQVTGLLLYVPSQPDQKGTFVQILEGDKKTIKDLYAMITRDSRHTEWTIVREGSLFQRRFPDWTMGFRDLSRVTADEIPGFNQIFWKKWTLKQILAEPDPVLQLIYSFAGV